ncbi:hypothetical protein TrVE_jg199 [Triparma verrucosa]|uniref:Aspartic peptidase DDI1-type domain-containing protein n=1 Tax=Triparma verrucosa TaxID=1606542 RepID=A0A9W7F8I8_9STRA|nr:hypothetical protein TrVE_jg199 [Triparma verrucosa]
MADITITILNAQTNATEAITLPPATEISFLKELAAPLVNASPSDPILYENHELSSGTLASNNVVAGSILSVGSAVSPPAPPPAAAPAAAPTLDFSALLAGAGVPDPLLAAPAPAPAPAPVPSFGNPLAFAAAAPQGPVSFDGMNLDQLAQSNPNPAHFVQLLLSDKHLNCLKELRFHNPRIAADIEAKRSDLNSAKQVWQAHLVKSSISGSFRQNTAMAKEREMEQRLRTNPMDEEANKYFGEKIRLKNVDEQYREMMESFPEAMGRVLMLYIKAKINGKDQVAFVDSGAQMTVMSYKCAEKLGILHLVDERFAGVAVGVGESKILGKVHLADIEIEGCTFQMTVTVMDDNKGLGDKNMDFLLGLDMLKRHRCSVNLASNTLDFSTGNISTPFLQEYQLDQNKGGTRGFDPDKSNKEIEDAIANSLKDDKKEDDGEGTTPMEGTEDSKNP